jgi:uncharacterized membrane protein
MISLVCIFTGIAMLCIIAYLVNLEDNKPDAKWLLIGALVCIMGSFLATLGYVDSLKTRALQFYEYGINNGIHEYLKGNVDTTTTYSLAPQCQSEYLP